MIERRSFIQKFLAGCVSFPAILIGGTKSNTDHKPWTTQSLDLEIEKIKTRQFQAHCESWGSNFTADCAEVTALELLKAQSTGRVDCQFGRLDPFEIAQWGGTGNCEKRQKTYNFNCLAYKAFLCGVSNGHEDIFKIHPMDLMAPIIDQILIDVQDCPLCIFSTCPDMYWSSQSHTSFNNTCVVRLVMSYEVLLKGIVISADVLYSNGKKNRSINGKPDAGFLRGFEVENIKYAKRRQRD